MLKRNSYEFVIKEMIRWYRDFDFSKMRVDFRDEMQSIYINDDRPLRDYIKIQIAINVYMFALAYEDKKMHVLEKEIMGVKTKAEAKQVLDKISQRLNNSRYQGNPLETLAPMKL